MKISSVAPGFIDTNFTKGFPGAKKTPEQGAIPLIHGLFSDLKVSGLYYGSDCVRSPLHAVRMPGKPEFTGY